MATESVLAKSTSEFLYANGKSNICLVEKSPTSRIELKLHSQSQDILSLSSDTPSHGAPSQHKGDAGDSASLFPAIFEIKKSSKGKGSSFGLLSDGFYNDKDGCLANVRPGSAVSNEMSSSFKSQKESEECRHSGKDLTSKSHKSVKKKTGKSRKKSQASPVLKKSQTTLHLSQSPKLTDGASKIRFRISAQETADLNVLSAQCRAVKMHEHTESKMKLSFVHNSFHSKELGNLTKPSLITKTYTVSKSMNQMPRSQNSKGDNRTKSCSSTSPSPIQLNRRSLAQAENVYLQRVTKVYLSEKHSGVIKDEGLEMPCAPPATPTPEQLRRYEYVPSLTDIRSQRAVRQKLQVMEKKEHQKEEKKREEQARIDKMMQKDKESELRRRQRQEIYALNKIMTELEHKRFVEFCLARGFNS
ncbi:uncharacterized protein [Haliotis cracherodii]|uniref:uncharacterized protein n=1 Tax=Haliotis cracherodii TaxID=6455 RepID=UPI0039E72E2B